MIPDLAPLRAVHLPFPRREGKVRDLFELPPAPGTSAARLLIVATDRISAFDVVMPDPIPGKGRLLTELSGFWFELIESRGIVGTHTLRTDVQALVHEGVLTPEQAGPLKGRSCVARRCRVVPIECVARGYLDGSGWAEYQASGSVCGVALPTGLRRGDRLPAPIFTPATKEQVGTHDVNIDFDRACDAARAWLASSRAASIDPRALMSQLRDLTLTIYSVAHDFAKLRGLILADTKFEFGFDEATGELRLVDEALTPDSSRYWDAALWKPGGEQPSFDKQFLREYLNTLTASGRWNKQPPGPPLPPEVIHGTRQRYEEVQRRLFST